MTNSTYFFIFLAVLISLGLSFYQYFYPQVSKNKRLLYLLAACRFIALFAVFLLLINPQITQTKNQNIKTVLPVYVDQSKSIEMLAATQQAQKTVDFLSNHKALNEQFDVQFYGLGSEVQLIVDSLDQLKFTASQTRLDKIAKNNQNNFPHQKFPTLILTDGNQTQGADFQYNFNELNPVFAFVLGDTTTVTDLRVGQINVNKYAFLKNKFPMEVFLHYSGLKKVTAECSIENKGKKIHSQKINFDAQKQSQVVEVLLNAEAIGLQQFEVKINGNITEKNTDNNLQKCFVDVIDQRTEIALVADMNHPDLGTLKRSIEVNQQRKVTQISSNSKEDLSRFDVFILYQPTAAFAPFFESNLLKQKNKFIITGLHTDFNFLGKVLTDFSFKMTTQKEDYTPAFNADFQVFKTELTGFEKLQPLQNPFGTITPNANIQILAQAKIRNAVLSQPLVCFSDNANLRMAYIFGQDLWKWRSQVYINTEDFDHFDRLMDKSIQYLSVGDAKKRLDVRYENNYNSSDDIRIAAQFFNKNYEFDTEAQLSIKVISKSGGSTKNYDLNLSQQEFSVQLIGLSPGLYDFVVTEKESKLSYKGFFEIIDFEVEKQFVSPNVSKLMSLAVNTKGSVLYENTLNQWVEDLLKDNRYTITQKQFINKTPLIEWYFLLIIIALVLSIEWFVRKYNGLI